jgi:hypothetical protein
MEEFDYKTPAQVIKGCIKEREFEIGRYIYPAKIKQAQYWIDWNKALLKYILSGDKSALSFFRSRPVDDYSSDL